MASTSPGGASRNVRRSSETMPQPPATATLGSSSAATSGVTKSPVGSRLVSSRTTTSPTRARMPQSMAAAVPSRALVQTISGPSVARGAARRAAASASRASACSVDGSSATMTTWVPAGTCARSPASARARSSGQSVATRMTLAMPLGGSSSRDGTEALAPYRTRAPSGRSGGCAGSRLEVDAPIDDLPAGRLDLRPQAVGRREVPGRASRRARARRGRGRSSGGRVGSSGIGGSIAGQLDRVPCRRWIAPCGPCCSAPSRSVSAPA